jgi:hypothetical protein
MATAGFSRGSFKASTMPAALWNDVSMEDVGMIEEEQEPEEQEEDKFKEEESFEKRSLGDKEAEADAEVGDKGLRECSQDDEHEVHSNQEAHEDPEGQREERETSLGTGENSLIALSQHDSDFPALTEEAIKLAIVELLEENSLSQGDQLKVWKQAIASKIKYPLPTIPKSWNETILVQLQMTNEVPYLPSSHLFPL